MERDRLGASGVPIVWLFVANLRIDADNPSVGTAFIVSYSSRVQSIGCGRRGVLRVNPSGVTNALMPDPRHFRLRARVEYLDATMRDPGAPRVSVYYPLQDSPEFP